jgi:hypothetical protein
MTETVRHRRGPRTSLPAKIRELKGLREWPIDTSDIPEWPGMLKDVAG